MSKLACSLALFVAVVVCTEAIRIDTVQPTPKSGKYFPNYTKNDPRCKDKENGSYANEKDCSKYYKCVNGDSQDKQCAKGKKFDSKRRCIPARENPDCGIKTQSGPLNEDEKCPDMYGIFPYESDCHKYISCFDGIPTVQNCTEGYHYRDANGGCVEGEECTDGSSAATRCTKSDEIFPDEKNCRRYIKCVNSKPLPKECPPGKAFNREKKMCTKEALDGCKNNDIQNVGKD